LFLFLEKGQIRKKKGFCKKGAPFGGGGGGATGPTLKRLLFLCTYGLSSGFVDFMFIKVKLYKEDLVPFSESIKVWLKKAIACIQV